MNTPVLDRIRGIVADIFEIPADQVQPSSSPDNVPTWDSLRHLNLVLALEQEFNIQFTPEEIEELLSVQLIGDLVIEKVQACGVA